MKTFEAWFDKLHPGRQAVLREDKWMLARASWNAALEEAQAALIEAADNAHKRGEYAERDRLHSAASALRYV
jgi:hypothetical protein